MLPHLGTKLRVFFAEKHVFQGMGWFDRKEEKATHTGYLCLPEEQELIKILFTKEVFLKSSLCCL